jgi:hypothetical protein
MVSKILFAFIILFFNCLFSFSMAIINQSPLQI